MRISIEPPAPWSIALPVRAAALDEAPMPDAADDDQREERVDRDGGKEGEGLSGHTAVLLIVGCVGIAVACVALWLLTLRLLMLVRPHWFGPE